MVSEGGEDPHILAHVNIERPDYRYQKLKTLYDQK